MEEEDREDPTVCDDNFPSILKWHLFFNNFIINLKFTLDLLNSRLLKESKNEKQIRRNFMKQRTGRLLFTALGAYRERSVHHA